ncbi:conserved hypothetical protein [Ricinus communis]|uniref:Glycine-rich protein n=1 Tax=Ricinus communis TaxID=3988 RepID=B9S0J7_RICCO|nr:conserved hypothetical protein [Ricinus communis]
MKKSIVLFLVVAGVMVSSCMVVTEGIGEIYVEEQRQQIYEQGKANDGRKSRVDYSERSIDNHHSIPRQYYDRGGSPQGGDDNGGKGDDGSYRELILQEVEEGLEVETSSSKGKALTNP